MKREGGWKEERRISEFSRINVYVIIIMSLYSHIKLCSTENVFESQLRSQKNK